MGCGKMRPWGGQGGVPRGCHVEKRVCGKTGSAGATSPADSVRGRIRRLGHLGRVPAVGHEERSGVGRAVAAVDAHEEVGEDNGDDGHKLSGGRVELSGRGKVGNEKGS
jgi:hypothetical protein